MKIVSLALKWGSRTSRRRHFGDGVSAMPTRRLDISATGHLGDRTFRRWDISATGHFGDGTSRRPSNYRKIGHLGDETFRRQNLVGHFGDKTLDFRKIGHLGDETTRRNNTEGHFGNVTSQLWLFILGIPEYKGCVKFLRYKMKDPGSCDTKE